MSSVPDWIPTGSLLIGNHFVLQPSKIDVSDAMHPVMSEQVDVPALRAYLVERLRLDSLDAITAADISLSIEGSPTLTLTINDYDRRLLNSGILSSKFDVQVDGIWFRLQKVSKSGDSITLTMELREVAVLRMYASRKIAHRRTTTRAEFVRGLIKEVLEFDIPVVIPELHRVEPIQGTKKVSSWKVAATDKSYGLSVDPPSIADQHRALGRQEHSHNNPDQPIGSFSGSDEEIAARLRVYALDRLTSKKSLMTEQQRLNASVILSVGSTMEARRKILVCAIMTAIDESNLYNVAHGDVAGPDSLGLFQQRASWGSKEDRLDPATSARLFFKAAISADAADPTLFYWDLCHTVQRNADAHVYDLYKTEAERIVSAFGIPGGHQAVSSFVANNSWPGASEAGDFLFYRGNPSPSDDWRRSNKGKRWAPEDSWTCILRNADDVNWRAFFAPSISSSNRAMTFYYIGDDELFKSIPIMTINEFSEGIDGIDFDYDNNKRHADVTITARCGRWYAAPGSVVILQGLGPVVGRWLVTAFDRSLFDLTATITLRKPRPRLPEPTSDGIARADTPGGSWGSIPTNPDDAPNFSQFPFDPNIPNGTRQKVVATALRALAIEGQSHYNYSHPGSPGGRPYPNSLWSNDAHGNQAENKGLDCSSFVTLVFKEAGADDPNGYGYNGTGYTGSLLAHAHLFGEIRSAPLPGDLIFYGDNQENVSHVAVYVGSGEAVGIGSEAGIKKLPWNYRAVVAIGSYFPVEESR